MLASSGTRNSPNASNIEGLLGCNLFRVEIGTILEVICLLCRQFALASAQATGTCRAKPQPRHPIHPYIQLNHSLTTHSIISNARFDDFVSIGAVRHPTTCALMQHLHA